MTNKTNKTNKIIIFGLALLLLVSTVMAAPPEFIQESAALGVLSISVPKPEFFVLGQAAHLHFHVFNGSGHKAYDQVNCTIHLYNNSGKHILEQNLSRDGNLIDFYVDLNTSFTQTVGEIPYVVQCVDELSKQAGFFSGVFHVAKTGPSQNNENLLPTILGIIGMGALLLYFMNSLDEEHILYKLIITVFFLGTLILIPSALINGQLLTQDNLLKMSTWFMRIFFIYIVVYFIYSIWLKGVLLDIGVLKDKSKEKKRP